MKKKTLKLNDLKVKSFITNMNGEDSQTVKGGTAFNSVHIVCQFGETTDTYDVGCGEDEDVSVACTHDCSVIGGHCGVSAYC